MGSFGSWGHFKTHGVISNQERVFFLFRLENVKTTFLKKKAVFSKLKVIFFSKRKGNFFPSEFLNQREFFLILKSIFSKGKAKVQMLPHILEGHDFSDLKFWALAIFKCPLPSSVEWKNVW